MFLLIQPEKASYETRGPEVPAARTGNDTWLLTQERLDSCNICEKFSALRIADGWASALFKILCKLRIYSGFQDLSRRPLAAGNGAMHGAVMPGSVSGFAGEKKSVRYRRAEGPRATFASGFHVAVSALRKGIGIPIVKISGGYLLLHSRFFEMQKAV